jgi:multiple sugar transport system permease protein
MSSEGAVRADAIARPAAAALERRAPRHPRRRPSAWHLLLLPLSLIFIFPFVQMLLASFMTTREINAYPPALFPHHPTLHAYGTVLRDSDFPLWFRNSLIVTSVAVVSQLLLCPLAGYAFARMRFIGTRTLQLLLLTTVFIPPQLLMIPVYKMYAAVGLVGTLPSLFLPWMASAISIFLMRQFFVRLPREIEEAAMIDGCSRLGVFMRVLLPLMRPALATIALLTVLNAWNDFLWPLISISDQSNYTLQLGLLTYQGQHHTDWAQVMATNVMVTVPLLVVFLLGQRHFVRSLTFSGIKG